jgi:hypothetical protein
MTSFRLDLCACAPRTRRGLQAGPVSEAAALSASVERPIGLPEAFEDRDLAQVAQARRVRLGSGFTDELRHGAAGDPGVVLIAAPELYQ